jgi:pimeloyl-ACP methyl ester carboxylesterase
VRARQPDKADSVERDGVPLYFEVFGDGNAPTVLLLPTWSIVHSRFWKAQVPYLARHHRVVTFDGRGSGRSGRPAGAPAYADEEYAVDALAVMDATGTDQAIVVGFSCGARVGRPCGSGMAGSRAWASSHRGGMRLPDHRSRTRALRLECSA